MKLNNLLTGILLAGSSMLYGQNSNENYKKISDLYGKQGEKIVYKNYSKIPWDQTDSNKINIKNLEGVLVKPNIENKDGFRDSVFAEAEKLGYTQREIEKLNPKEAVDLAINIIISRYDYDDIEKDRIIKDTSRLHNVYKNNDFYFFRKMGVCMDYSRSFIGVLNIFKEINKHLINLHTTERVGRANGDYDTKNNHSWNQLILLTKDSVFLSDIDPTNYDDWMGELEQKHFNFKAEPKIAILKNLEDHHLNYFLYKELLNQIPDTSNLKLDFKKTEDNSELFYKKIRIEEALKKNYIEQRMSQIGGRESSSIKKQKDSLFCEYKNIEKEIGSLTEKVKKYYGIQKYEALQKMFRNALATEDTSILEDVANYFVKYSFEEYILTRTKYCIYKDNKIKDKARELKEELIKRNIYEGYSNIKKEVEIYIKWAKDGTI